MSTSRIPKKISDFNDYIRNTDMYLHSPSPSGPVVNWLRLGLTQEYADAWQDSRIAWDVLYAKYINPNTRTKVVTTEVQEGMEIFRAFAQPLLDIMAACPAALVQDAETLNFKIGRSDPTHPHLPIGNPCLMSLASVGGGRIRFSCRAEIESKRAALPAEADCLEVAYKIGGIVPANPFDGTSNYFVTRASDVRDFGVENAGQVLYVFARWNSMRHPELAGVWCPMNTVRL
ncbi:MAG: hypothetical protein SH857_02145 [Chitinophagales bacterium]|nr:hypothetical protein [Chitinophagales bacterium]